LSSRRRHTRFSRDWSSDVCSSDLDLHELARLDLEVDLFLFPKLQLMVEAVGGGIDQRAQRLGVLTGKVARHEVLDLLPLVHAYRSEEHTSELQSRENLVCRLLLEK